MITEANDKFILLPDSDYNQIHDQSKMGRFKKDVLENSEQYINEDDMKNVDKILQILPSSID